MSLQMNVPAVGESITEVTVARWLKEDGEAVELDDVLCELESDKATFELVAESDGILKISPEAQEDAVLEIGALLCTIEEGEGAPKKAASSTVAEPTVSAPSESPKATGQVLEMVVPTVGESITEVTIASWAKEDGDFVELDDLLCEIESDKATFELTAEESGILRIIAQEDETLEIGAPICKIEVMEGGAPQAAATPAVEATSAASTSSDKTYATGHASPAAAKILAEKGIDVATVKGTGVDGRITKEDAEKAQKVAAPAPSKAKKETAAPSAPAPVAGERAQRREKMTALRKTVARRLVSVKNETAMLTTFNEVDMKPVMDLRKKYKEMFKDKHEIGLGFMSFFTKAVTVALQEWPAVNAFIDGNQLVYNDYADISIAVSAPKGLVVPVIRNAESLSLAAIEKEVRRLALKARDNKLTIPEMEGGTFTITNGGVFGSMLSTPIINAPQSAILGMHNIVERPVAINGEVHIRPIMYVALSYDHRIIDGRESVSFLKRVKELLEDPIRLLLDV
ncbi:2-oxoglutarate dehydrogenase complex dihydrolipoyllysine-residue succinyltransferase [Flammeovirga pectinis]|uniref:Dihydrolipoyllysine-residue succinyltransferase component of 2-oxoglutarate dehydrogenase complex n=1 Tax=Flammeovirga pectinis TaxID=2494373 RepID=A0A3S9P2H0_9BACT|nr:2-oxoglutarate dehydrogenase complex dihydrolipoyllysine-residue succinyltransferase [Flammeovirga pectinis]AZQ62391.1 2-oxoglutarate dehydrogenase complex dihydrolipoyllysine-residue succinyltransferase [Flammeovirga pectinis]